MDNTSNTLVLFNEWLSFAGNRSVVECEFFNLDKILIEELLGEFSSTRLRPFGKHASGSLFCFYVDETGPSVNSPIAWIDSEGAPCIVISNNFGEFLSILGYGSGLIYTVAAAIENNLGSDNLLGIAEERVSKSASDLLLEAKQRFLDLDSFIDWLGVHTILLSDEPVKRIVNAHIMNPDLTTWINSNL